MYQYCISSLCYTLTIISTLQSTTQPLIILLDAHQEATEQKTGAITNYLAYSIIEKSTPILVNGAVFHNFLLLQQKNNKRLNTLPYPTIESLVQAVNDSKQRTKKYTLDTIQYLARLRNEWYQTLPIEEVPINETLLNDAAYAFLSLIPTAPITTTINEAEYQIVPVLNQFLEIFQNECSTFFKEFKTKERQKLNTSIKKYNTLLKIYVSELESLKKILYQNLHTMLEAHNLLTHYTFEYTYRFAHCQPNEWEIYFQKEQDLYLLLPLQLKTSTLSTEKIAQTHWNSHEELMRMIVKNTAKSQGLFSLYQHNYVSPLQNIDHFFKQTNGVYDTPLDICMIGHGSPQEIGSIYAERCDSEQNQIAQTITFLNKLISRCEQELMANTKSELKTLIDAITNNKIIQEKQYLSMAYAVNKKFIEEQHAQNKNPLNPNPHDIENFLQKELIISQKTNLDLAFYWLLLNNLVQKYQEASNVIFNTKLSNTSNEDYVPESAHVAGLTVKNFQDFIADSRVTQRIHSIYFLTCFGGGRNRLIFQEGAQQLHEDTTRKIDLAVGSLTDAAVPSLIPTLAMFTIDTNETITFNPPLSFKTFFEKKLSIDGLKAITVGQKYSIQSSINQYFHGVADLPWKYNHITKKLELINLNNTLINITKDQLDNYESKKIRNIKTTEEKVIMLHEPKTDLILTLDPEDQLLPLLCSAETTPHVEHTISEIHLPNHTLEELLIFSIAHLRQTKTYNITIETLNCMGIQKKADSIALKNVRITSTIPKQSAQNKENNISESDLILWNIAIDELPYEITVQKNYIYKDYFDHSRKRILSPFFKK